MVQLFPDLRLVPQVLLSAYPALAAILVKFSGAFPLLVSVTFWPALTVPMICCAKVRLVGTSFTPGADAGVWANSGKENEKALTNISAAASGRKTEWRSFIG